MEKSYFTLREWAVIVLLAVISALINSYLPVKSITEYFGIPGPAAGMALLGGVIFVLWVSLAYRVTGKKYSGVVASLIIAAVCLFIQPWYGVSEPSWFSVYGIVALGCMGVVVEVMSRSYWRSVAGGGLANLSCLAITWLALGFHTGTWAPGKIAPLLGLGAVVSGSIGALIAQEIARLVQAKRPE